VRKEDTTSRGGKKWLGEIGGGGRKKTVEEEKRETPTDICLRETHTDDLER
jgi:hypothetical protein